MNDYNVTFTIRDDEGEASSNTHRIQAGSIRDLFTIMSTLPIFSRPEATVTGVKVREILEGEL